MEFEQLRKYRLYDRDGPGLACDAGGVALAGIELVASRRDEQEQVAYRVRSQAALSRILGTAYGRQAEDVVFRVHRGLRRVAARLEAGDLAAAAIEAVLLRIPEVSDEGLRKLGTLVAFDKGGSDAWQDEPRVPRGQREGGQWTDGGPTSSGGQHEVGSGSTTVPGEGTPGDRAPARSFRSTSRTAVGSPRRQPEEARSGFGAVSSPSDETTVNAPVRESRTPNANGFFANTAGGGVYYVPSISNGRAVRPTEIHVVDAHAYHVAWTDDTITLTDRSGRVIRVSVNDLAHFNATTGRMIGVSIYGHPDEPLGDAVDEPTAAEREQLERDRTTLDAGMRTSEDSPSGRIVSAAVVVASALPFLAFLPAADAAVPRIALNTAEETETAAYRTIRLGREGERAAGITEPKEAIRVGSRTRFPDALDRANKILIEVKNVAYLRLTPQLRDYLAFCRANGYTMYVYARRSTTYSPALRALLRKGEITIIRIPGT